MFICPYCGKESVYNNREHFFPQSVVRNIWDFAVCPTCNKIKGDSIVYPSDALFEYTPRGLDREKFKRLWDMAGVDKYERVIPVMTMRHWFLIGKRDSYVTELTTEEKQFYQLDKYEIFLWWATSLKKSGLITGVVKVGEATYVTHDYPFQIHIPFKHVQQMNTKDLTKNMAVHTIV